MKVCLFLSYAELQAKLDAGFALVGGPYPTQADCAAACPAGDGVDHATQVDILEVSQDGWQAHHRTVIDVVPVPPTEYFVQQYHQVEQEESGGEFPPIQQYHQVEQEESGGEFPPIQQYHQVEEEESGGESARVWHDSDSTATDGPLSYAIVQHSTKVLEEVADGLDYAVQHSTIVLEEGADGLDYAVQHHSELLEEDTDGNVSIVQHNTALQDLGDLIVTTCCPDGVNKTQYLKWGTPSWPNCPCWSTPLPIEYDNGIGKWKFTTTCSGGDVEIYFYCDSTPLWHLEIYLNTINIVNTTAGNGCLPVNRIFAVSASFGGCIFDPVTIFSDDP